MVILYFITIMDKNVVVFVMFILDGMEQNVLVVM
ncbi:MAG: hypothetical protein YK1312THETA_190004 [Marine Group I thaumarchaeote]|nr:MAG: hypothetical protein YK1312THETA_190004 [Marine Group I thaumarchaeote]